MLETKVKLFRVSEHLSTNTCHDNKSRISILVQQNYLFISHKSD